MAKIIVKTDELYYCLSDGLIDGAIVPYGERATLDLPSGEIYTCLMPEPEEGKDPADAIVHRIDEVTELKPSEIHEEEVEFSPAIRKALQAVEDAIAAEAGPLGIEGPKT